MQCIVCGVHQIFASSSCMHVKGKKLYNNNDDHAVETKYANENGTCFVCAYVHAENSSENLFVLNNFCILFCH